MPSRFRNYNFDPIIEELEDTDLRVKTIGERGWNTKPNLYPFLKSTSKLICSGYSAIVECSLSNSPAIIFPQTPEQKFIAERLKDKVGFYLAQSPGKILNLVDKDLENPREYTNEAKEAAQIIRRKLPE